MSTETCPASVLLIEDDERWRETIGAFLEARGYPTALAGNVHDAFALLETIDRPCLVLVDWLTMDIDFPRLVAALETNDRMATLPMIIGSVAAPELLTRPAIVKRPVDLEILYRVVQDHCCAGGGGGARSAGGERGAHVG
jgi:CheY-like chemotaxis protein